MRDALVCAFIGAGCAEHVTAARIVFVKQRLGIIGPRDQFRRMVSSGSSISSPFFCRQLRMNSRKPAPAA